MKTIFTMITVKIFQILKAIKIAESARLRSRRFTASDWCYYQDPADYDPFYQGIPGDWLSIAPQPQAQ